MQQQAHQHAFTSILPRSALMGTQDCKLSLLGGTTGPSFAPVTAFQRARQESFRATKRGRWGSLHVTIAWKIYYQEKLKRRQQKPISLHPESPECPDTCPRDSAQREEPDEPVDLDCENSSSRVPKPDWGQQERPSNPHRKENLGVQQADAAKASPVRDRAWDGAAAPHVEVRLRPDRKRPLECSGFVKVKRAKQLRADEQIDPSETLHADPSLTRASLRVLPVQSSRATDLSVPYPHSGALNFTRPPAQLLSYPPSEMHPYQTASWESTWNKRLDHKDYSVNGGKVIRLPLAEQRQKEDFGRLCAPHFYFPLGLRQQETLFHPRGREFLHALHSDYHLRPSRHQIHHPGFLATTYLGP